MNNKLELTPARAELLLYAVNNCTKDLNDKLKCVKDSVNPICESLVADWAIDSIINGANDQIHKYCTELAELDFMRKFIIQYLEEANGKS